MPSFRCKVSLGFWPGPVRFVGFRQGFPSLGYTGNLPALDKESDRIGGARIPEGALTPRAERPRHGRSGELVNREMPGSRGWIPGGLRFSQPIKPSSAGSDVGERELLADNRRHARRIEPGYGRC